jgi:hypothetical protein
MPIPFEPDHVLGPLVVLNSDDGTWMHYFADEERHAQRHVRVTFEHLDAIRVCRGEYLPYPEETVDACFSLYTVENSPWLRERHAYEAEYYRDCYEFGGDVDVMLTDYEHFLFCSHDEFVEAIAMGVWFENAAGLTCQVRTNPKPLEQILADARYCSQPLYHFLVEGGTDMVDRRLDVRVRRGSTRCYWRRIFDTIEQTFEGLVPLDQAKALMEPYMRELAEFRRQNEAGEQP